jgi:hypothetical protein
MELMAVVQYLDGLLEADGYEESDYDGGDVDEEVSPGVSGVWGRVDVQHGSGSSFGYCCFRCGDEFVRLLVRGRD